MFHLTPQSARTGTSPYPPEDHVDVRTFFSAHPELAPTPLKSLPALARALGTGALYVKDESSRFGLNAFKGLGVRYAVDWLRRSGGLPARATLVCASAGNHGRAVARVARDLGYPARVYMSSSSADGPRQAIGAEGAAVIVVDGTYDDAVRIMATDAAREGWTIISDTSWPGYTEIPRRIMLGYTRLVDEVRAQLPSPPDVVFAQAGVGGLVCGVAAGLAFQWPAARPRLVACEPSGAACLLASARAGRLATLEHAPTTIMAGLRCAEPSPAAWPVIAALADAFVAIEDERTVAAMRALARPLDQDPPLEAGPSGACSLAALVAVMTDAAFRPVRDALALGPASSVVVINTEGATDPELYRRLVEA